ncbi:MAG: hypothetical protein KF689_01345 [Gemmatimonadaceae bacterium]|nr:hypothetical protein [Gemmatimonadaceae bacterium]MCW5826575.1 hypothetical protein [Gemmatimonadaceae bacterium]
MRLELVISGMVAVHAKHAVFAALAGVPGVLRAQVELGRAEIECERRDAELEALEAELGAAVAAAGFVLTTLRRLPRELPLA